MEETLVVANPEIPRAVSGDGVHDSAGHPTHGDKPAIIEVGDPAERRDPNSPAFVLKQGLHIAQQSAASLPINRNPPVIPSVQAIESAKRLAAWSCLPLAQVRHELGLVGIQPKQSWRPSP